MEEVTGTVIHVQERNGSISDQLEKITDEMEQNSRVQAEVHGQLGEVVASLENLHNKAEKAVCTRNENNLEQDEQPRMKRPKRSFANRETMVKKKENEEDTVESDADIRGEDEDEEEEEDVDVDESQLFASSVNHYNFADSSSDDHI
eukprot:m.5166 g.5166  ORF g.5166 m.5166 type:complete len:147 (+) comp2351_c0_seq1:209-649(+)